MEQVVAQNSSRESTGVVAPFMGIPGVDTTFIPAVTVIQNGQTLLSFSRFGQTILSADISNACNVDIQMNVVLNEIRKRSDGPVIYMPIYKLI
ncbi:MAG: hypothetical protein ACI8PB_004530 [Desulforhopalus sp.]|jgi:hypothetical protein